MKRKISLFMICGVILLGVCGCGKENSITGTYNQTNANNPNGDFGYSLKLYENGTCYWEYYDENSTFALGHTFEYDTNDCTYDYNEDEIIITTYNKYTTTCSIDKDTINCREQGTYSK